MMKYWLILSLVANLVLAFALFGAAKKVNYLTEWVEHLRNALHKKGEEA